MWLNGEYIKGMSEIAAKQKLEVGSMLRTTVDNFFMTDAISRASSTMAKCVQARQAAQAAGK